MSLPKLFERIFWHNNTTPAVNETNLNAMSQAIDDIDNRVIDLADAVLEDVSNVTRAAAAADQAEQYAQEARNFTPEGYQDLADDYSYMSQTLSGEISARTSADASLQSQIDQLVAPSGEAPSAAEVQNARIGADGKTYDTLGNAIRGQVGDLTTALKDIANIEPDPVSVTFTAVKQNINSSLEVTAGQRYSVKITSNIGSKGVIFYVPGDENNNKTIYAGQTISYTPNISGKVRFYNRNVNDGYIGSVSLSFTSDIVDFLNSRPLVKNPSMVVNETDLNNVTNNTKSANDFPLNTIICVGNTISGFSDYPDNSVSTNGGLGVYITFDGTGRDANRNGTAQLFIGSNGMATRWKVGSWQPWRTVKTGAQLAPYAQYNTRSEWTTAFPSDKLADIPVNKIVCIGGNTVSPSDAPFPSFTGNVITLSSRQALNPGAIQYAFDMSRNIAYHRVYYYKSSGNYWGAWYGIDGEEYHVGTGQAYTSLTSLLLDLAGNIRKKTIYIHDGEYDIFQEYLSEIEAGRLTIPPDDVTPPDYFGTYNAFVPTNTRIIGLGKVTLKFTPTVAQLESMSEDANKTGYGASRTWSPLNIYGSVDVENITVIGHNCRYCLHNDDHNAYTNVEQHYKNVRFLYYYSDVNSQGQRLGFNHAIGFGIQAGSKHIYEDCEMYIDDGGSAYYGHEGESSKNGFLILRNCRIHSGNFSNDRVIRLQSLAESQGKVNALFESCYINGGLDLNMYNTNSPQNYETVFVNCNKVPVKRTIASGGTIVDPYTVTWYNSLPTPTAANPLIETNSYNG